jgi:2,4-dienoyl-CoA reductase-like NADH-dependent reductase (Old Yellow Enzyme family)
VRGSSSGGTRSLLLNGWLMCVPWDFSRNSQDFADGGFSVEESRIMAERLEDAGVDLIELSGGSYEVRESPVR